MKSGIAIGRGWMLPASTVHARLGRGAACEREGCDAAGAGLQQRRVGTGSGGCRSWLVSAQAALRIAVGQSSVTSAAVTV